ncbi:HAMP domain-containing histidine kinase [bacterium]|nr:HAMP domain-containing histidine kinase [bacterium]
MKKMKLFPKTFLYTFFMLFFITTSMHLMIYFFYPKVYLSRMQDQLEKKMDTLQQEIKRNTAAEAGQIFSDFAKQNNVNVTVECAGSEVTYMGMDFQISLYTDADMVFDVSNLENAESIIVKNKTMEADDGIEIQVEVMASAMPVKEAVDMITFLLPFTFGAAILFSIVFSYLYSRHITRPIFHMLNVTNDMKNLKPEAAFHVQDEEKEHMLAVEKSKTVFLRSASHELKTPLSGLRILLENMQYNIGKYKDRDKYLAEAVAKVDELSGMVRDILDTSKVQDLQEEEKQKLYAGGEIGAVLQEYAMQIADKKLEVTDSIPEDCMLFMSRNTFQKVWSNLIGNAVQYTEQGGQITIAADTDKIWIENSCTPLTEEQLAYIYEPFYRVDDTRAASGGNGLGLYVVRELLKKEGFRYVFEPVEDGMRFTIFL